MAAEDDDSGFLAFGTDRPSSSSSSTGRQSQGEASALGDGRRQQQGGGGGAASSSSRRLVQLWHEVPWYRVSSAAAAAGGEGGSSSASLPSSPLVQLHNEVLDFCDLLAPTKTEVAERHKIINTVKDTIEKFPGLWSWCEVQVFGSEATKVFLPESDVDVVVLPDQELPPHRVKNALFRLADAFRKMEEVTRVEVIAKARIPLLKVLFGTIQVDVSFSNESGLKSARLVLELMEDLAVLRPLVLVIKYFLAQRELNETYHGGAGSFLVQLMLVGYLQHRRREAKALGRDPPPDNLGATLLGFLRFYAQELNREEVGVSVMGEGKFFRKVERGFSVAQRPLLVSVENPLDPTLDVGKNSYNMDAILDACRHAYHRLLHTVPIVQACLASRQPPPSLLSALIRPDDEVLAPRSMPRGRAFRVDLFSNLLQTVGIRAPPPQHQQQREQQQHYRDGGGYQDYGGRRGSGGGGYDQHGYGGGGGGGSRKRERAGDDDYDYHYEEPPRREERQQQKRGRWSGGRLENNNNNYHYDQHDHRGDDGRSRRHSDGQGWGGGGGGGGGGRYRR